MPRKEEGKRGYDAYVYTHTYICLYIYIYTGLYRYVYPYACSIWISERWYVTLNLLTWSCVWLSTTNHLRCLWRCPGTSLLLSMLWTPLANLQLLLKSISGVFLPYILVTLAAKPGSSLKKTTQGGCILSTNRLKSFEHNYSCPNCPHGLDLAQRTLGPWCEGCPCPQGRWHQSGTQPQMGHVFSLPQGLAPPFCYGKNLSKWECLRVGMHGSHPIPGISSSWRKGIRSCNDCSS